MREYKFNYKWKLSDGYPAPGIEKHGLKVFSTFACGGGSTMGYKLAGYDVIGANDIDAKMAEVYKLNHKPKYYYLEGIQTLAQRTDFPDEFYNLDILDGSPPCSSFSMAGNREKDWGKEKKFREGQAEQVLDTLFFDFIELGKKLQPKVIIAENVKGILLGDAIQYVRKIYDDFDKAGYYCQHWLLDASKMGVPQRRERVFFIALRKDLANPFMYQKDMFTRMPKLDMLFNENEIAFKQFADYNGRKISEYAKKAWDARIDGDNSIADSKARCGMKVSDMNTFYIYDDKVSQTLTSKGDCGSLLFSHPIRLSKNEFCKIGTFPLDYKFKPSNFGYLIGMSVPPVMMAQIAYQVYLQWLLKL
jgi:DNA (cytosine-5)-methyltransferase 1